MKATSIIKTKAWVKGMIGDYDYNQVFITKEGYYTNGAWMLKPKYMTKPLKRRIQTMGGAQKRDVASEFLFEDHGHREIEYDRSEGAVGSVIAIYKAEDLEIGFDEKYIAWLQKNIPGFGLKAYDPKQATFIMSGDEIAGVIASIRL